MSLKHIKEPSVLNDYHQARILLQISENTSVRNQNVVKRLFKLISCLKKKTIESGLDLGSNQKCIKKISTDK